ncbi:hypothetical protein BsWGS_13533 [Bradybaena similaris]
MSPFSLMNVQQQTVIVFKSSPFSIMCVQLQTLIVFRRSLFSIMSVQLQIHSLHNISFLILACSITAPLIPTDPLTCCSTLQHHADSISIKELVSGKCLYLAFTYTKSAVLNSTQWRPRINHYNCCGNTSTS